MKKKSEPGLALLSPASLVLALVGLSGLVSSCYGPGGLSRSGLGSAGPSLSWPYEPSFGLAWFEQSSPWTHNAFFRQPSIFNAVMKLASNSHVFCF